MKKDLLELLYKYTEADEDVVRKLREMALIENKKIIDKISNSKSQYFHIPNYFAYPPVLVRKNRLFASQKVNRSYCNGLSINNTSFKI